MLKCGFNCCSMFDSDNRLKHFYTKIIIQTRKPIKHEIYFTFIKLKWKCGLCFFFAAAAGWLVVVVTLVSFTE